MQPFGCTSKSKEVGVPSRGQDRACWPSGGEGKKLEPVGSQCFDILFVLEVLSVLFNEFVDDRGIVGVTPFYDVLKELRVPLMSYVGKAGNIDSEVIHIVTGDRVGYSFDGEFEMFSECAFVLFCETLPNALRHETQGIIGLLEVVGDVAARFYRDGANVNETMTPTFLNEHPVIRAEAEKKGVPMDTAIGLATLRDCEVTDILFSGIETESFHEELKVSLLKPPRGLGISKGDEYIGFVERRFVETANRPRS